jgi:hypothetical protein
MEIVDIHTGVAMYSLGRPQQAACQLDVVELL